MSAQTSPCSEVEFRFLVLVGSHFVFLHWTKGGLLFSFVFLHKHKEFGGVMSPRLLQITHIIIISTFYMGASSVFYDKSTARIVCFLGFIKKSLWYAAITQINMHWPLCCSAAVTLNIKFLLLPLSMSQPDHLRLAVTVNDWNLVMRTGGNSLPLINKIK